MSKFLVLYMAPAKGMEEWMKKPEAERKAEQDKMQGEWGEWMKMHQAYLSETAGAGKTKRVTTGGVEGVKNDVMLFSLAEGTSHDEVAKMFERHPHLGIPGSWIDVMPANSLPGMKDM
ncbi:MAG: hypothetical protein AAB573_04505 [Patescibacteria group bacterium]